MVQHQNLKSDSSLGHSEESRWCCSSLQTVLRVAVSLACAGAAVETRRALQGELSLRQAKGTMGKLTHRLITANELEQSSSAASRDHVTSHKDTCKHIHRRRNAYIKNNIRCG